MSNAKAFAQKLRILLQVLSQDSYTYGHKSGRLNQAALYRVPSNLDGYSTRVFKRVHENKMLDLCMSVLMDMSGSMSGSKISHAIEALCLLNEMCNVLHIPCQIMGFSTTTSLGYEEVCYMPLFRDFNDKIQTDDIRNSIENAMADTMSNNQDGEALAYAYDKIKRRSEKRKIMIVLSDGQPACYRKGDYVTYLKKITEAIQKAKVVELYGVGIITNSVKNFYKNNTVINNVGEIEQCLLEVIKNAILKKGV